MLRIFRTTEEVVALPIPSSVLKLVILTRRSRLVRCSPPDTVIGIETLQFVLKEEFVAGVVALPIPSSVLKRESSELLSELSVGVVALPIPSSVLKPFDCRRDDLRKARVVALPIPSSVLKPAETL